MLKLWSNHSRDLFNNFPIIVLFFWILWRLSFPEKRSMLMLPSKTPSRCLGKAEAKSFVFYSRCTRYHFNVCFSVPDVFHGSFSQINFFGEALSLPSAFFYFAVVSLLVQTACRIFVVEYGIRCLSQQWNSLFRKLLNFF